MRRLTAALAALVTALGLALVVAQPAEATISSPTGIVQAGTITATDSGGVDNSSILGIKHCSGSVKTTYQLLNSVGAVVQTSSQNGAGVYSVTIATESFPNGNYTLRFIEGNGANSGFGGFSCTTSNVNVDKAITITNTVDIAYSGANAAPQNTTTPVTLTLTDPSNGSAPVSGLTVTAGLSGGGSASGVTNAAGQVALNLPVSGPPRSAATLTLAFAGTAFWAARAVTRSFDVTKNASTVTLAQPATIVHGQALSFVVAVTPGNGTGIPSGTVAVTVDGSAFQTVTLDPSGNATTTPTTTLSTGSHTIGATYNGDGNFLSGAATTKTATINQAATTTSLVDAPAPTVSGQQVTFTATVGVVSPGVGTPTGGVQFNVDGQPFGTAVPLSGLTASLSISNLAPGNHNVVAVYNGDPDFSSSNSATVTHGVNKADSNLALTSSDLSAVSGEPLTYTAVVTAGPPGSGTPTGTVQFAVDGNALGAPVALVGGQATSPVTNLLYGSHHVTANYSGDANFGGSNNSLTQSVAPGATTTSVASSPNPSVFGQSVTIHAEASPVAPATGHPTGAIRFVVDGSTLAIVDTVNGAADLTVSTLAVGSHPITARFLSDDINFTPSTSAEISQVVNKAATSTVLVSSSSNSVFGQPVTFTATVSVQAPGAGSPSGSITFKDGSTVLDTVPVNSSTGFTAQLTTAGLSVGQHAITATYSGDGSFLGSNASATQTVQKASTSVLVTSSNNPSLTGQPTTFTAVVTPVAPGAGDPSGTVLFTLNGLPLGGSRPVSGGVATSPAFSALTPGTYKVQAQYSGDGNFFKSAGLLDQGAGQGSSKGATTSTLSATPTSAAYNAPVTFTATVSAVAPAAGNPSGVVRFWEGGVLLGSSSLTPGAGNSASTTFVSSTLQPGGHNVRAEYVGNFNFTGSDATTSVTVDRAPTTTGVTSSANPATFGDSVTLTATVGKSLPAAAVPTGSVTFKDGSAVLGTATLSTVGGQQVATLAVAGLHGGAHPITAVYSGDTGFSGSTSPVFTQNVTQQATTLVAGSPVAGSPLGTHAGYVRAKLTDASGNPLVGKTISFTNKPFGSRPAYHLCDAVTGADGVAECDYTVINIDAHLSATDVLIDVNGDYDATYVGSADYLPATARGHLF